MMEFWMMDNRTDGMPLNKNQIFQFPVNPPSFEISSSLGSSSFNVEELGEINFIGRKNLITLNFSSFFPARKGTYCLCNPKDPYEYIEIIQKWRFWQAAIRFIITGTPINMLFSIENFTYKEVVNRDIEFSMELKEYKILDGATS